MASISAGRPTAYDAWLRRELSTALRRRQSSRRFRYRLPGESHPCQCMAEPHKTRQLRRQKRGIHVVRRAHGYLLATYTSHACRRVAQGEGGCRSTFGQRLRCHGAAGESELELARSARRAWRMPPAICCRATRAGPFRTVGATRGAWLIVAAGNCVPIRIWSTACRLCALSPRSRCVRDADAADRPPETGAYSDSSPTTGRGRSDTCRSSLSCFAPGVCPTSELKPPRD